jgi:hypothetical protein
VAAFLIFCCALLLALTGLSLWRRRTALALPDVFMFAFALYFGGYTLVDVLVKDLPPMLEWGSVLFLMLQVAISMLGLWWLALRGPRYRRRNLRGRTQGVAQPTNQQQESARNRFRVMAYLRAGLHDESATPRRPPCNAARRPAQVAIASHLHVRGWEVFGPYLP